MSLNQLETETSHALSILRELAASYTLLLGDIRQFTEKGSEVPDRPVETPEPILSSAAGRLAPLSGF